MNDIFAQIKNNAMSACNKDSKVTKTKDGKWLYGKNLMHASQNLGQHIGSVKFQDVFDEFRNVKRNIAFENHYKSIPALLALFEAIMEGTKDLSIVQQFTVLGSSKKLGMATTLTTFICIIFCLVKALPHMKGLGMDDMG